MRLDRRKGEREKTLYGKSEREREKTWTIRLYMGESKRAINIP